jgi:hypothetical protein
MFEDGEEDELSIHFPYFVSGRIVWKHLAFSLKDHDLMNVLLESHCVDVMLIHSLRLQGRNPAGQG